MSRDTAQRRAILAAIETANRPLAPQEILDAAQSAVPNLGIATVYRTVKRSVEDGKLAVVEVPGEGQRYEAAGKGHHHHFTCRKCDRMFEIEGCPGGISGLTPDGFVLEDHEIFLYGVCRECAKSGAPT